MSQGRGLSSTGTLPSEPLRTLGLTLPLIPFSLKNIYFVPVIGGHHRGGPRHDCEQVDTVPVLTQLSFSGKYHR